MSTPTFPLIPFSEIDDDARRIAVAWVEQYGTMGFDLENKHKLASDIMNYHRMNNKWIKVSDKKPPKGEPILIFNGHWIGVGYYKKNFALNIEGEPDWSDETTEYIEPGATHWMPLPEPPKK